jgi:hypothetical protein
MKKYGIPTVKPKAESGSSAKAAEHFLTNPDNSFELEEFREKFGRSIFTNNLLRQKLFKAGFKLRQKKEAGTTLLWIEKLEQTLVPETPDVIK